MSEIERWRGETDARLRDAERRLDALNGNIARGADALASLNLTVAQHMSSMKTWGLIVSFIAALVAPVATGCTVFFITH